MEAMRASHLFDSYRRSETGKKTAGWSESDIAFHKELLMLAREED